ncbi:MAG: endonuclease/exonuclease/phosphatase family protein [Lentisphaeria bacterium]|nr:endonuclease/exonuclease/phosphatase family protein [Lentisphaeria bacterium]NQZ66856.1 endonuclease/exonuclease/phosphatase family protein [Lentisphaeria bacterium]
MQYLVCYAVALIVALLAKSWKKAAFITLPILFLLTQIVPGYVPRTKVALVENKKLKLLFFNVYSGNRNYNRFMDYVKSENPDIIVLAEVNYKWWNALAELRTDYPHHKESLRDDNFGIAMLSRIPFDEAAIVKRGNRGVPSIRALLFNKKLCIWGTHPLPPRRLDYSINRNKQLKFLANKVVAGSNTVIIGDLNTVPWSPYFKDLLTDANLYDSRQGYGNQASWPSGNSLIRIPIDHCLLSPSINVISRKIGPDLYSDHLPVVIEIEF